MHKIEFNQLDKNERFDIVLVLAKSLMLDIEKAIPIVPSVLLASVFLANKRKPITKAAAKQAARELMDSIEQKGGHIVFPHKEKEINLNSAIEMLQIRHLITIENELCSVPEESVQLLTYYENSIKHWL